MGMLGNLAQQRATVAFRHPVLRLDLVASVDPGLEGRLQRGALLTHDSTHGCRYSSRLIGAVATGRSRSEWFHTNSRSTERSPSSKSRCKLQKCSRIWRLSIFPVEPAGNAYASARTPAQRV